MENGVIEFHSLEHILVSRHPLGCVSKGKILLTKSNQDVTEIEIILNPNPLRGFAILFPTLFIPIMTMFGHWVTEISIGEIIKNLWSMYVCVICGSYLIYLLIKQTVIRYFDRLLNEARNLV